MQFQVELSAACQSLIERPFCFYVQSFQHIPDIHLILFEQYLKKDLLTLLYIQGFHKQKPPYTNPFLLEDILSYYLISH